MLNLVGVQEIAELLGVDRATVISWNHQGRLPDVDYKISGVPIWHTSKIVDFITVDSFIQSKVSADVISSLVNA